MQLNTIVKTIKRESHRGNQGITTDQTTTDIVACINETIRDVQKLVPKRFWFKQDTIALTVGVVGTPSVWPLPEDCQEPILFHYTSNGSVTRLDKLDSDREWIDEVWDPTGALNKPTYFREIGSDTSGNKQIEIFPIPNTSYTLNIEYYKIKDADLAVSDLANEVTAVPDYVQDVIAKGALYYFLKQFDDPGQGIALGDYKASITALEIADERDQDTDIRLRFNMMRSSTLPPGFRLP